MIVPTLVLLSQRVPADQPLERKDENSQIAHRQLLDKAKKGGIDVYFEGDSITRRWGTSDVAWRAMYDNWKANFWGWNAADFGWGGDTTNNILWRLGNGELDGVNPKVVVILAGTNNVGGQAGGSDKVADVTRGVKAIVDLCRRKAPRATIMLTAIFPRQGDAALNEEIAGIDANLAKLADGKRVRFVNVNDRFLGTDGKLRDGMTIDGLHPSAAGYQAWADGLKPILAELLGPPAKTDHAPPPTGDPSASRPKG